jgi:hypothetical protein
METEQATAEPVAEGEAQDAPSHDAESHDTESRDTKAEEEDVNKHNA